MKNVNSKTPELRDKTNETPEVDSSINEIVNQLRGNLATIRGFLHFLETEEYNATQKELRELHEKLENHLEKSQTELIKKLEALSELCSNQNPN